MNRSIFRVFFSWIRPIFRLLLMAFFDRKYLQGRFFDLGFGGYVWALRAIWCRNILRLGTPMPWPVALGFTMSDPRNVAFHPDDLNNFQSPGVYLQNANAKVLIGRGTYIAPNVGLITANHQLSNLDKHELGRDIVLGECCWIGMNAVILPGVTLGPKTVVGAGAVVSKSFPDGHAVLAGVPATLLKRLT